MKKYRFVFISLLILSCLLLVAAFSACQSNGKQNYEITYLAAEGGKIEGNFKQTVQSGEDAEEVTAIADIGYYFVKWSDGVTSATRQDKNITSDAEWTAEFAEITDGVTISYKTYGDGYISTNGFNRLKEVEQFVQRGTDAWRVEAIPQGYGNDPVFIEWSDGLTTPVRQDKNITEEFEVTVIFGFSAMYSVQGNGRIEGSANQLVVHLEDAETVTAVPDTGYTFVGWSDGVKTATRTDTYVRESFEVTAIFEWHETDNFIYHYNYATNNTDQEYLTLTRGEVAEASGVIPERDYFAFGGWYLDEDFTVKAISETGKILLGEEIFNNPSRDLYAKWTVNEEYVVTYKILMVYVTAIDAELLGNDGSMVNVHYRMSDSVRQICGDITRLFSKTLNDMLDGLVKFEVDSYFTSQTIGKDSVTNGNGIYAEDIWELTSIGILDEYRAVLTTFSFDGNPNLLYSSSGSAHLKYATIPLDRQFNKVNAFSFDSAIEVYVHEFIHTIEQGIVSYEYHQAIGSNNQVLTTLESSKLYLLNQCPINLNDGYDSGERVGIPYTYWTNEIYTVIADVSESNKGYGYVINVWDWWSISEPNPDLQQVPKGSRSLIMRAEAFPGFRFIGWADGVKEAERVFYNVQQNIHITALFEKIAYSVSYIAGEGGRIDGNSEQIVLYRERSESVTAVANEGYVFIGWSDGETNPTRDDFIQDNFIVTAIFKKLDLAI